MIRWLWNRRVPIIGFTILTAVFLVWFGLPIYLLITKGA